MLIGLAASLFLASAAHAQVTVWVDFTSDTHNSIGGGPNGVADWIDELAKCTTGAGVTAYTGAEVSFIEGEILSQLGTIWADYDVTFTTSMPGSGAFDAIAYGKTSHLFTALGIAPTDPANIASGQVGGIATGNFDFILDEFSGTTDRVTQLAQVSTALAGTGAHELGHTFGLYHHQAYSDPSILPPTYGATGGVQNKYIIATGDTGLTEAGREVLRTFSPWGKGHSRHVRRRVGSLSRGIRSSQARHHARADFPDGRWPLRRGRHAADLAADRAFCGRAFRHGPRAGRRRSGRDDRRHLRRRNVPAERFIPAQHPADARHVPSVRAHLADTEHPGRCR